MFHVSTFSGNKYGDQRDQNSPEESENATVANAIIFKMVPEKLRKYLPSPANFSSAVNRGGAAGGHGGNSSQFPKLEISDIKYRIKIHNDMQLVLNSDTFGPLQNESLVIVIQVHTRLMYLRHMIISLAEAEGIDTALLVFSHDYYDEEINALVRSIDFCKVIQIFYPYSIQTHPKEFPGESLNDCPRNINYKEAIRRKCANALFPDSYGHYREAAFTQTKHHWWWKANKVFNGLNITRNYTGLVLFLEEDHYVAPDFIYMLQYLQKAQQSSCHFCSVLSLGTYLKNANFPADFNKVEVTHWVSSKHNMGMAFTRSVWNELKECATKFCKYDDYNWDWSLQTVSNTCLKRELVTLMLRAPRVYHIGECGVHHKNSCHSTAAIRKVRKLLLSSRHYFYPRELKLMYTISKKKQIRKGNGGWADIRDVNLCLNMTLETAAV